jgi:hypothetical protein
MPGDGKRKTRAVTDLDEPDEPAAETTTEDRRSGGGLQAASAVRGIWCR